MYGTAVNDMHPVLTMRERLQNLADENAKLRERNRYLMKGDLLHVLTDQEYIDQCERERLMQVSIDALDKENAKLRELVRHMGACIQHLDRTDEDGGCVRCPYQPVEQDCEFEQRMAELGIEVDG